jgi:CheY-like chemotaxis protein
MKRGSILLVEDDADDRYFIARAFQETALPASLHEVTDGQRAIDFLAGTPAHHPPSAESSPCLVLLDLNLPRKSGLEVLKWIRRESSWKTIVVIVLTSSTSEDDRLRAYLDGANAFVIKPPDPTQLREFAQLVKEFWLKWNQFAPADN